MVPPASRGNRVSAPLGFPSLREGNRVGAQVPWKGTTVRHEVFEAGAIFPSASVNRQVRCIALTPFVPLSRLRERGNALQGAPPCAPTPLSHTVGEGLGVRAKKRARLAHSELKRCTLIRRRFPASRGEPRMGSVPPASRGNLKEGVFNLAYVCKVCLLLVSETLALPASAVLGTRASRPQHKQRDCFSLD
jgi:hypothetical protein